jgi:hypothetical protein
MSPVARRPSSVGAAPVLHWFVLPTKLPRHTITETPDVQAALDELRRETGRERLQLGELVILGAQVKVRQLRDDRQRDDALLADLADRIRRREPLIDADAADQVRRAGWTRP